MSSREAAELKLVDIVKNSILKVGDVIAYKRKFTNLDLVIEKDVIVRPTALFRVIASLTSLADPVNPPKDSCLDDIVGIWDNAVST